jgi:phenylacetate-CoA ligase
LPRFRRAYKELDVLAARETWSRSEIENYQLGRLNNLWRHAVAHVPYYRALRAHRRLPPAFTSFAEFQAMVPVLDKPTITGQHAAFLSETAGPGVWHRTSGSTGVPMRVFRSHDEHLEMLRAMYRFYAMWGVDIFDRMAWLWSTHDSTSASRDDRLGRNVQEWKDRLRNRLRLSASHLDAASLRKYLRRINDYRPAAIYGFSRAVYMLALEAQHERFRLARPMKFICLTGEPASEHMRQQISHALGAPAIMEYGSVDCGFLAGEAPDDRTLRVRADVARVETQKRPDGKFDILVTVLTNSSFPLFRYKIGDVTDTPLERPERGFPILRNVAGRNDDLVVTRTGRYVHSTAVDELFEMRYDSVVRRYRVHQDASGAIRAMVELQSDSPLRFDPKGIACELEELVEGFPVDVQVVDAIPQTAAGKHRLVTSELASRAAAPAGNLAELQPNAVLN